MKLEKTIIKSWKEFLLIFTLVFFYSCRPFSDTPFKHKSKKYKTLPVTTIEDAEKYAIGVWTFTEPIIDDSPLFGVWRGVLWHRFDFKEGGVGEYQRALPTDDDWGAIEKIKWKIATGKYVDTGKRYFKIVVVPAVPRTPPQAGLFSQADHLLNFINYLIFVNSRSMYFREDSVAAFGKLTFFTKRDVFPFSK